MANTYPDKVAAKKLSRQGCNKNLYSPDCSQILSIKEVVANTHPEQKVAAETYPEKVVA